MCIFECGAPCVFNVIKWWRVFFSFLETFECCGRPSSAASMCTCLQNTAFELITPTKVVNMKTELGFAENHFQIHFYIQMFSSQQKVFFAFAKFSIFLFTRIKPIYSLTALRDKLACKSFSPISMYQYTAYTRRTDTCTLYTMLIYFSIRTHI